MRPMYTSPPNETVNGIEFHWTPNTGNVPLVADMTSSIASKPINIEDYGLIYAAAQKNLGIAGITIVIIKEKLAGTPMPGTPSMFNYRNHIDFDSLYNTVPVFNWYMASLILEWLLEQGGMEVIGKRNQSKAKKLYDYIDGSDFYANNVDVSCRSVMNVPFTLKDTSLKKKFLEEALKAGLFGLKGHKLVGGMRASIYNAMPEAGVIKLIEFMDGFAKD